MDVFLIRHTRTAVVPGTCYGNSDVDVAGSFPEEAERVRVRLEGERFDAIYSSPLQRCRKLAIFHLYTFTFSDKPHPSHKKPPTPSNQLSKIFHFKCICRELRYS